MSPTRLALLLAALAMLGAVTPVAATGLGLPSPDAVSTPDDPNNSSNVSVEPGAQLSTVLAATEITTRGEIETTRFELEFERGNESERAEAITERAETLAERAAEIREAYEEATAAHEAGELTTQEYARQLAELNARAEHLLAAVDALRDRARNVSALELEAAGLNRSAIRAAVDDVDPLAGVGPSAILRRFLGESTGEVELRTDGGLRVEVEGERGERSLEVSRDRDDDPSLTVGQDAALQTARDSLPPGNWTLRKASVHPDDGYYKFEFGFTSPTETGEAEVRVDGSSGEVFRLEVEIETPRGEEAGDRGEGHDDPGDEPDRGDGDEHDERELTLLLVGGTPAPNETITVRALANGQPVANLTVFVNDHAVAETDAHGRATLTLPHAADIEVSAGDEAELEFEFHEADHAEREVFRQLDANVTLRDGRLTVEVTFGGRPVEGATVYANDRHPGQTDADGTVAFAFDPGDTDELELEIVKGGFEAEFEFAVRNGGLVLTESAHEGDGDKVADEHEEDDEDEDHDDEDDGEDDHDGDDSSDPDSDDGEHTEDDH